MVYLHFQNENVNDGIGINNVFTCEIKDENGNENNVRPIILGIITRVLILKGELRIRTPFPKIIFLPLIKNFNIYFIIDLNNN